ncbi:T9SS type A sorting domain-containing protein [candidate division WOR-3 bacterium]|nr:T9SS type A sorting domain-containing protein [candidate division WOR-3 bacterium]
MKSIATVAALLAAVSVASADTLYVGRVDTIGGTAYDWLFNGPVLRWCVNSEPWGIHAAWMSAASASPWPDRNMRYNFYDYSTRRWNWIDPDFMASGINTYTERTGFGSLGADPATGVAVIVAHGGMPIRPIAARDMAPGAGIFEFCDGSPTVEGFQWPAVAVGQGGIIHVAGIDNATQDQLWYGRIRVWCVWDTMVHLSGGAPDPMFPAHNIAASLVSPKVCIGWVDSEGLPYNGAYYRVSTNAGDSWSDPVELAPPPAYGGDTVTSFGITSLFPYYDRHDRLHFVVDVHPVVRDTSYIQPAEIWHWCETNSPRWSEVHRAGCDPANIRASIGYNAVYAGRPSVGEDTRGRLSVAWEQFDSASVEPQTNLLRAGVWLSSSADNGQTWETGALVTARNSVSHRYPCVMDYVSQDTVCITYMMDRVAGFVVQGQGPMTNNPVACQFIPASPVGNEEMGNEESRVERPAATFVRGTLVLSVSLSAIRSSLFDLSGRRVMRLRSGLNDVSGLAPGVYFVRAEGSRGQGFEGSRARVIVQR